MLRKILPLALAAALPAVGFAQYRIDALVPPNGSFSATGIAGGHIVGNVEREAGRAPTVWTASGPTFLQGPASYGFRGANSVNRLGVVVGSGGGGGFGTHGIVWRDGVASILADDDGDADETDFLYSSRALGINDSGLIIGNATTQYGDSNGVVWDGEDVRLLLGLDPVEEYQTSNALAVNNAGQIVGSAKGGGQTYAATWVNGQATILDASLGRSVANDINDLGVAVGYGTAPDDTFFAFMHGPSGTTVLPTLAGFVGAEATGVNNSGFVVGSMFPDGFGEGVAALWNDGVGYDLNTLVGSSAWNLTSATGIDDDGSIVGFGLYNGESVAYRITPVPEPASMVALGLGVVAFVRRRLR